MSGRSCICPGPKLRKEGGKVMSGENVFRTAFWTLLALLLLIRAFFAVRVRSAGERIMPDQAAIEREGRGMFASRVVAFFLLIGLLVVYALNPPWARVLLFPLPGWMRWVGFGLGLGSLALLTWTQAELGKQWSAQLQLREEHVLVTSGPYSLVRHPLYTAEFGFGAAVALVSANWAFVVITLAAVVGLMARVPREEQMMIEQFGGLYLEYMKKTGRYFPRTPVKGDTR
jgi:protein-S-isoprenylcysteine O-methyltransferase Ste14